MLIYTPHILTHIPTGMDYLSDIGQWRSYCAVEDALVQGECMFMYCVFVGCKCAEISVNYSCARCRQRCCFCVLCVPCHQLWLIPLTLCAILFTATSTLTTPYIIVSYLAAVIKLGRFSLRGSELGWAKSWLLNLG